MSDNHICTVDVSDFLILINCHDPDLHLENGVFNLICLFMEMK